MEPEFLGEGSYGCVIKPAIKCDSTEVKLRKEKRGEIKIGKIFTNDRIFGKELAANKVALKVDKDGKYLLTPTSYCAVAARSIRKNAAAAANCTFDGSAKRPIQQREFYYQLNMPYGGVTLSQYVKTNHIDLIQLLFTIKPCFEALILLNKKRMCHQDIKADNILIKPGGKSILIDYSLMIPYKAVYTEANKSRLRYSYFPYPPEFKLFYYIHYEKCYKYDFCKYAYQSFINNTLKSSFGHNSTNHFTKFFTDDELYGLFELNITRMTEYDSDRGAGAGDRLRKYMEKYADRVDVYSLGMTLIKCMRYIHNIEKTKHWKAIQKFVRKLIHPYFEYRYTPGEALKDLNALLKLVAV